MRSIDWSKALSEKDIVWLRQTGIMGIEDRIARHQDEHSGVVPEYEVPEDQTTRDGLSAASSSSTPEQTGSGPLKVDPTQADRQDEDDEGDDYDRWTVKELEADVMARDSMPDTTRVVVEPTGANGKATKADLIKALRVWDAENPGALEDQES